MWRDNSSVQFSCSVLSNSLWPHGLQHSRPPCPSPTPGVYSNSCPSSWWCHPAISSSVIPFSSCPQSFPASGSFQMSQLFMSGGQNTGVSASTSVLPVNTQDWSPLGWTGWLYFGGLQNHCRWWLQPWNEKTFTPWKESYDQPRQHIKKQRHYFVNEGLSSQGYGFSSGHVWMWELDYKESWVPKNWCF